jgi:ATP-binding cassette, subfamily B, bacterial
MSPKHAADAPSLPSEPFKFAMHFLKYYWVSLFIMFLMETGQATCQIMIPYAVKELIDAGSRLSGSPIDQQMAILWPSLKLFVWLSVGIIFFSRVSGGLLTFTGPSMRLRARRTIFNYLQYHSQRFFNSHFSGALANRISEISVGVNHAAWTLLLDFWPVIITFGVSLTLLYRTYPDLSFVAGIWVFIYLLISFFFARRSQVYAKKWAAMRSSVSGRIVDSVTNILNAKLFAKLEYERSYLDSFLNEELMAARRALWYTEAIRWFQVLATMALQIGLILLAMKYWVDKKISVGSFAMTASLVLLVINEAQGLSRRFVEFFEYVGNVSDGVAAIVRDQDVLDVDGAKDLVVKQGEVKFDNVTFSYGRESTVFENLTVHIKSGERVGLVGFSGSGKTTFTNLILRMYDIQGGAITVDDQDISKVTQDSLRAQISMIPQEPVLFHRSLLENIRYGRVLASDEEVHAAAKSAHAHQFIMQRREGYAALVGERGIKLSGGQRQRIAIARAILKNAPILILDEATSSLDSITEKSIQASLEILMKNRTVIVIAHRLSTIAHLDRILVFEKGRIVESGPHDELLQKNGPYARLWNMQVGGFLPADINGGESTAEPVSQQS